MVEPFLIARNPDPDSKLPYLLRLPIERGIVLKARETWPRTKAVYCYPGGEWDSSLELIEEQPVLSCVRRGPAVDLVLRDAARRAIGASTHRTRCHRDRP